MNTPRIVADASRIVTFYSYKGGVGRTMALANVSAVLARWGYRVLCIDWDLEAPGLDLYFDPWLKSRSGKGLVELFRDYQTSDEKDWRKYLTKVALPGTADRLHLLAAGRRDGSYLQRMQEIDWSQLYSSQDLGHYLETLRTQWLGDYDLVLIDSRTGVSDIGGICTIQLPDILVVLATPNRQSIEGIREVSKRADLARNRLSVDRARLQILPIATRFEVRVEFKTGQEWLQRFGVELEPLYSAWMHRRVTSHQLLLATRVPYVPFWSFGEQLAVVEKGTEDREDVGFAFESMAALLANGLAATDVLVSNRETYVKIARQRPQKARQAKDGGFSYDVFVSYQGRDRTYARELADRLKDHGLRVFFDQWSEARGASFQKTSEDAIASAANFILILGDSSGEWQRAETIGIAREILQEEQASRRLVPVLRRGADIATLPPFLRQLPMVQEDEWPLPDLAAALVKGLESDEAFSAFRNRLQSAEPRPAHNAEPSDAVRISRRWLRYAAAVMLLFALGTVATSSVSWYLERREQAHAELRRAEDFKRLQVAKRQLDTKRVRIDQLSKTQTAVANPELNRLQEEVLVESEAFLSDLVDFINEAEFDPSEPKPPDVAEALQYKIDEDILIAKEYIERGGDYSRAIEIYSTALMLDPDYEPLQQALDEAKSNRFVTEDRFSLVQKGMTQEDVRRVLGQANIRNIREFAERNVLAWFYPRKDGGAAGVFFRTGGEAVVYDTDFDAIAPPEKGVAGDG